MRSRSVVLLFLTLGFLRAQVVVNPGGNTSGGGVGTYIVSTLPPSPTPNTVAQVIDGTTGADCTVGGGSVKHFCTFIGGVWVTTGGGSTGASASVTFTLNAGNSYTFAWTHSLATAIPFPIGCKDTGTLSEVVIPVTYTTNNVVTFVGTTTQTVNCVGVTGGGVAGPTGPAGPAGMPVPQTGLFASLPSCTVPNEGLIFFLTDSIFERWLCDGSAVSHFYGHGSEMVDPNAQTWTAFNAPTSWTISAGHGGIIVGGTAAATQYSEEMTLPAAPWTVTANISFQANQYTTAAGFLKCGIYTRDTGSTKVATVNMYSAQNVPLATGESSNITAATGIQTTVFTNNLWVQFKDDSTNVTGTMSPTASNYYTLFTATHANYAATRAGIFCNSNNSGLIGEATLNSFKVTTP